jgi:hypothetical protein
LGQVKPIKVDPNEVTNSKIGNRMAD